VTRYAVKEIFYTLQGEGLNAGRSAVFLRFSGCNLWSGRLDRREGVGGCAKWCDTDFAGTDGTHGGKYEADELAARVESLWPCAHGARFVVCTGGEPLLQLDAPLIEALHARGFEIAIETNGTIPVPAGVDWICVSPKGGTELVVCAGDELKLVFPQPEIDPESVRSLQFKHFILQPMDGPNQQHNMRQTLEYCLTHPWWRLGVQAHKVLGIR
jgi:7-carboxy-7-deazaguanine synthase (Cx14CxxC type)